MNFFTENVPGLEQLNVATCLHVIASFISLVYISIALGCGVVSYLSELVVVFSGDEEKADISYNCARIASKNMAINFVFGVLPFFILYYTSTQLLFGLDTSVPSYFLLASIFSLIGLFLLNQFRNSLVIKKFIQESDASRSVIDSAKTTGMVVGFFGLVFLLFGSFFLVGGRAIVADPSFLNKGFLSVFDSFQVWLKFIAFLFGAFALSGVVIVFFFASLCGGFKRISDKAKNCAVAGGATMAIVSIPLFSIFTGLNLKFIPRTDFSLSLIVYSGIALIALFLALHMMYYSLVHKRVRTGLAGFLLMLIAFGLFVIADNAAVKQALRKHSYELIKKHDSSIR